MSTIITDYAGLVAIANDLSGDYILGDDIDASGETFTPLGTFTGSLSGARYEVSNLTITVTGSGTKKGSFIDTNQGTITDFHLVDCTVSVIATLNAIAASLVRYNDSTGEIARCSATGTVTGEGSSGGSSAVGLVWSNDGAISKSFSEVIVSVDAPTATASGFVEENIGTISNSYARGNATATGTTTYASGFIEQNYTDGNISKSYSTGKPTADTVAGFCRINDETITNCFWDEETSGTETSDGGTGLTTLQAKAQLTYTNADWDFCLIWNINPCLNDGYPYFRYWAEAQGLGDQETRSKTITVKDPKGRIPKGATARAYRTDTDALVETETLDSSGQATFTELPNDVAVVIRVNWGGTASGETEVLIPVDILGISDGGTGSSDAANARGNLGLGSEDSPQFTAIELGDADDTTLSRESAGDVDIEGNIIYRAGGTDVPVTDGGTGASTAAGARTNLVIDNIYSCDYGLNWADLGAIASNDVFAMAYLGNGIVILGDVSYHVYRSIDYGANWTDLGVIASGQIYSMASLGNGIALLGDFAKHVYRSTDYGLTWTDLGVIASSWVNALAYLGNGIALLGDDAYHVYRSTDYGATWADLGVICTNAVWDFAYLGGGIVILGDEDYHVFRSTDYGANWADLGVIASDAIHTTVYLGNGVVILADNAYHIYRSTDYGANWTDLGVVAADAIMARAYLGKGVVILGDEGGHVFRSTDYGANWTDLGAIATSWIYGMAYLGNGITVLGDGVHHVWRSTSAFQLWEEAGDVTLNTDTDVSGNTWVLDEDNMASDSAAKVATQQSVKAYIDSGFGGTHWDAGVVSEELTYDARIAFDLGTSTQRY